MDKLSVLISSMHGTNGNIMQLGVDSDRPRLPPALPQCPFLSTSKSEASTVVGETVQSDLIKGVMSLRASDDVLYVLDRLIV